MKLKIFFLLIGLALASNREDETLEPFELDEYLKRTFSAKGWNGTWVTDEVFLAQSKEKDVYKVQVPELKTELFLKAEVLKNYPGYSISATKDFKYILIRYNQKSIFRHSTTAQFAVYDTDNKKYYDLADKKHLQIAKWAPTGHGLVYVLDNNIYYVPSPERAAKPIQITKDGVPGVIYNGVPDWVYEEEVLGSGSALWFSPGGTRLAFATFDDRGVDEFHYFIYGEPGKIESQYPDVITLKYPKVGRANPLVAVKYVDLVNPAAVVTLEGIIPTNYVTEDHVLKTITWADDSHVVAVAMNRVQNVAAITRCDVETTACGETHLMEEERGWLDISTPVYSKDGVKFLSLASEYEGTDSFKHIVIFDSRTATVRTKLTRGRRVILSIYGWDEARDLVYYLATVEGNPSQQHVYAIHVSTHKEKCLTCNINTPEGPCLVASAVFSKDFSYFTRMCSGPGPLIADIVNSQTLNYFVWEDNSILRKKLAKKQTPVKRDLTVPLPDGFEARVRLLLPPGLNENDSVKYPMIVNVYAGPNSNRVSNAYSTGVENYFVTNRQYIYAYIDGRGSGKDGDNLMFSVYRKLGTLEIEDQIIVTKYLQESLPYVDASRTAIWGWSYGGFSTLWALVKDKDNVFKMGVSIAPVTNFIYYDSIYTERYMGLPTPEDNEAGYNNTDISRQVEGLRNKSFLLIHGNADDNVHYQQSMLLAKALERADILFYQQSYPDENHSLTHVSPHLYHTLDRFFDYGFRSANPKKWKYEKSYKKHVGHRKV